MAPHPFPTDRRGSRLRWLALLWIVPAVLSLGGCGGTEQRPGLVATFPDNFDVLSGPLSSMRFEFDEPVTILNPVAILVVADGLQIPMTSFQLAGEPNVVYAIPTVGATFRPDTRHFVRVLEALVVNADQQYALDPVSFSFDTGPEPPIAAGAPQAVRLFDRETFALLDTIPTPNAGTDDVVGLLSATTPAGTRYWVQRSDPGTGTDSFAYFDGGDLAMTEVALTRSTPASSLVSTSSSLALGPAGQFVYVAYRELPAGLVRLAKVDATTGLEVDTLVLSPAPGATTAPTGMAVSIDRRELAVACTEGAAGRMVFVDLDGFTELDRDPVPAGVQGVPLPNPPGELESFNGRYVTTSLDGTGMVNAQQVLTGSFTVIETTSTTTGVGVHSLRTLDQTFSLQTVSGYTNGEALVARTSQSAYTAAAALIVSDDVGGMPTNTNEVIAAERSGVFNLFLLVHDGGILTRWFWDGIQFAQLDLDDMTDGIQAVDGGMDWSDIVTLAREEGRFPP